MTAPAETTQGIIDLIGEDAFAKLSAALGGTSIKVPKTDAGGVFFAISGIVGNVAAQRLITCYGGDQLYISTGLMRRLSIRNAAIRAEFDALTKDLSVTATVRRLSLSYRISERQINDILKRLD